MLNTRHVALADLIAGSVVLPGDDGYDDARTGFNVALGPRPEAVVFVEDARDVAAVVHYARDRGLRIAAQATGHNPGPHGSMSGSLLLSVERLKEITIDRDALSVRVGAGVRWREVVPQLSELGLAALHGSSPDVGIAGYSLGGGMGWLARKHGLQCNAVTAIEVVVADGRLVRCDAEHEPDLFWALRGGNGNFGVVTAIEFRVVPIETFYAGGLFFGMDRAREVMTAWSAWLPSVPEELMTWLHLMRFPDVPEVPEALRGGAYAIVLAAYAGDEVTGAGLLAPIRALGADMDTFATVAPEGLADLAMDPRDPLPYALGHRNIGALTEEAIDRVLAVTGPDTASTLELVQFRHMGGALSRAAAGAGARATLPGQVSFLALGVTPDEETAAGVGDMLAGLEAALAPWGAGAYPNFIEETVDTASFFGAETWKRLQAVKREVDPGGLFRGNHEITGA